MENPKDNLEQGKKYDTGKPRWDLIPFEALEEVVKVYTMGAEKYADENWRKGIKYKRIIGAVFRHFTKFVCGQDLDDESGLPHLAHVGWGVLTLIWYSKYRSEFDDRYIPGNVKAVKSGRVDDFWNTHTCGDPHCGA